MEGDRDEDETPPPVIEGGLIAYMKRCYWARIFTIEPAVFLYMMGGSILVILSEQYYFKIYGLQILLNTTFNSNGSVCMTSDLLTSYTGNNESYKEVQAYSNHLVLYVQLVNKFSSILVTTLVIIPLTDRVGRRIGLVLPAIGNIIQGAYMVVIIKYNLNPYYFILGGFVSGMFGDLTSTLATSFAYTADVSRVRWRSLRIGVVECFMAAGSSAGQLSVGYWLQAIDCYYIPPMILYIASSVAIIVYVVIFVPPELTKQERRARLNQRESLLESYSKGIKLYCGTLDIKSTWKLYVATVVANVTILNIYGSTLLSVFYLKSPPLGFQSSQIGIYQSVRSLSQGLANFFITGLLVAVNVSDLWMMLLAFTAAATCDTLMGLAKFSWQIYTLAVFQGLEGIAWAGSRGLASKLASADKQGALFSIIASLESVTSLLSSVLWPAIYPATLHYNLPHGTTYFIMASGSFLTILLLLSLFCVGRDKKKNMKNQISTINSSEKQPLLS